MNASTLIPRGGLLAGGRSDNSILPSLRARFIDVALLIGLGLCASLLVRADTLPEAEQIRLGAGKTHMIDTTANIRRVAVAAPDIAEAVPVSPRSIMLNGHVAGETSLIVWLDDGSRREFVVNVTLPDIRLDTVRQQFEAEFDGKVSVQVSAGVVYLSGTVRDLFASQRAISIAESLGRVVNLLKIDIPPQETQILLKVRFADVDRNRSTDLGINFAGAPAGMPFSVGTGSYGNSSVTTIQGGNTVTLSDALNVLFFDPKINVGATLKDLESKAVLQILAEPNVLALNGHTASFISGGEVPIPAVQGGTGTGQAVSISFRQFGVQISFLPIVTPRGTIRLHVTPEVSSLDYADALQLSGFTVPAISTRKIETDVELKDGQSFAIAGLLDQRTTDSLSRIPGLADIPLFGKLFTSRATTKSNSELLVIVTPQLVAPISDPESVPDLTRPTPFLKGNGILSVPPQTPGPDKTGPPSVRPAREQISIQEMEKFQRDLTNTISTSVSGALNPAAGQNPGAATGGGGAAPTSTTVGGGGGTGGCIYALDPTAQDAMVASGGAVINTNCGIVVESNNAKALELSLIHI